MRSSNGLHTQWSWTRVPIIVSFLRRQHSTWGSLWGVVNFKKLPALEVAKISSYTGEFSFALAVGNSRPRLVFSDEKGFRLYSADTAL